MAFNAGGTNVGGVAIREPGELKGKQTYATDYTTGSHINLIIGTVPAGKIWVLKNFSGVSSSFSGTFSYLNVGPIIGENQYNFTPNVTSVGNLSYNFVQSIQLPAGTVVRAGYNLSAYTSGTFGVKLLYQEIDA